MKPHDLRLRLRISSRMRSRARIWSIPLAYIVLATILGHLLPVVGFDLPPHPAYLTPSTASSLLATISSGMIAFTGFVFSMVFVLIQFGSTTYTPRLAGYLLQDAVVRHSLGVFTGTFLFTLNAASYVDAGGSGEVPDLAIAFALLLVTGSAVMFLALIERITSLRVTSVLHMVGERGRLVIGEMYPHRFAAGETEDSGDHQSMLERIPRPLPQVTQTLVHRGHPEIVVMYDLDRLVDVAERVNGIIEIRYAPGDTLHDAAAVLRIRGADRAASDAALRSLVETGHERTIEQDPKYAIRLIVDIAIRALSPAVNDPTTAVQALDQIEDLLHRIGVHYLDVGLRTGRNGAVRVIYPTPDWEDYLSLSIDEIRLCGANSIQVMRRLQALLQDLLPVLPAERARPVRRYLERVNVSIRRTFADEKDRRNARVADRQGMGLSRPVQDRGR